MKPFELDTPTVSSLTQQESGPCVESDPKPADKPVAKKDSMFKAILFMNFFAIFMIASGSIYKIVNKTLHFKVLDYLFLRNISMAIVTLILIFITGADVWKLPESRSKVRVQEGSEHTSNYAGPIQSAKW